MRQRAQNSEARAALDDLACGRAVETPQREEGVTYAEKINKAEAVIDWAADSEQVLRKATASWPLPRRRLMRI